MNMLTIKGLPSGKPFDYTQPWFIYFQSDSTKENGSEEPSLMCVIFN